MLSRRLLLSLRQPACRPPARLLSQTPLPIAARALFERPRPTLRWPATPTTTPSAPAGSRRYFHGGEDPRLRNAQPLVSGERLRRVVRSPSTHAVVVVAVMAAFLFYFSNLETVPVSGRTRFNCYSAESVREVGASQAKMVLYELEKNGGRILPDWDPRTRMVRRVMEKLIPFSGMADDPWEVFVIEDPHTANAFVLPGGKVFVYSGILPLVRTESGLAAVLGHEIAHNVAAHAGERLSQAIGVNILMYSAIILFGVIGLAPFAIQMFGGPIMDVAFGHPMSRLQESEADYIGLMMMAEACYDPREAAGFWRRMNEADREQQPEWMSTHPSNQSRIEKIQEWLPKAMEKRETSGCRTTTAFVEQFKRATPAIGTSWLFDYFMEFLRIWGLDLLLPPTSAGASRRIRRD